MLPSIAIVLSVEMVRDGGSLAAVFQGSNGSEYWLFFEIDYQVLPSRGWERLGYKDPVVFERQTGIKTALSWQHAKIFLNQMSPLLRADRDAKWLKLMQETAETQGQLPSAIERIFGQQSSGA